MISIGRELGATVVPLGVAWQSFVRKHDQPDLDDPGQTLQQWSLEILTERITVRELIRSRVYQEVQDYNYRQPERFPGLITPGEDELALNGAKAARPRQIDWHRQFDRAVQAFRHNQI